MDLGRATHLLERTTWLLAVLAATGLLGVGLEKNVYFENTDEALREAADGLWLARAGSVALVGLVLLARWGGAPTWAWVAVLSAPVVSGGLLETWPGSLFPQLAFLVVGPLTLLAALVTVLVPWRSRRRSAPGAVGVSA
jgi:hypothetical protein